MFTLADACRWLDLPVAFHPIAIRCIVTDSRKVEGGELFAALRGCQVDGHQFLEEVSKKGAVAALVASDYRGFDYGMKLIRVPDVVAALQKMAKAKLQTWNPLIVGVTGSVGKTTTKDFITTLLAARYRVAKSPGNANSQVGLPVTILNSTGKEEVLVLEMAMTEKGQIERLVSIAPPHFALITKIGSSHVGYFENGFEGIAEAKAEIFSHPDTKWGVASFESKKLTAIARGTCKKFFVGENEEADFRFIKETPSKVRFAVDNTLSDPIELPFSATHLVEDFALAVALCHRMGLTFAEIASKTSELSTYKNRFEIIEKEGILFLNDSYNASRESIRAALENLPKVSGQRIAVLSGMVEMGAYSDMLHKEVASHALPYVDHLLCFGESAMPLFRIFSDAGKPVELFTDFGPLKKRVFALAKQGDLVLLKGSNASQLWRVLEEDPKA